MSSLFLQQLGEERRHYFCKDETSKYGTNVSVKVYCDEHGNVATLRRFALLLVAECPGTHLLPATMYAQGKIVLWLHSFKPDAHSIGTWFPSCDECERIGHARMRHSVWAKMKKTSKYVGVHTPVKFVDVK